MLPWFEFINVAWRSGTKKWSALSGLVVWSSENVDFGEGGVERLSCMLSIRVLIFDHELFMIFDELSENRTLKIEHVPQNFVENGIYVIFDD